MGDKPNSFGEHLAEALFSAKAAVTKSGGKLHFADVAKIGNDSLASWQAQGSTQIKDNGPEVVEYTPEAFTALKSEISAIIGRKPTTRWLDKEEKALRKLFPYAKADLVALRAYYLAELPESEDYRRRQLYTLLNNFSGEIDRAQKWAASVLKRTNKALMR